MHARPNDGITHRIPSIIPIPLFVFSGFLVLAGCGGKPVLDQNVPSVSFAPDVPPPISRSGPDTVRVDLNAAITDIPLAPGVLYHAWSFDNHVPGPFIRGRVRDILQVTVTNSDTTGMIHNVDFHAVSGPGGGADITNVAPGQRRVGFFKLLHPGLFLYHCAARPLTAHIANGMYGLILVEPEGGMPRADREYGIVQSEFYTTPPHSGSPFVDYSAENGLREDPQYVLFNGADGALMGHRALRAHEGETVRIYFGNAGPNKVSSFHIVGAVFENEYREGSLANPPEHGVSTTLVPSGGTAILELRPEVPGTYTMMDHSVFRTEKGAMGQLVVDGPARPDLYSGG